jgi:hypothetical protein
MLTHLSAIQEMVGQFDLAFSDENAISADLD